MAIVLEPFGPESARFDDAVRTYATTWERPIGKAWDFMAAFDTYPDYRGLVAVDGEQVVGMTFGHLSRPGQWWHDRVAEEVGRHHPALSDAWVVVELAVLPAARRHGVGKQLLGALLQAQPYPKAVLSTQAENYRARRFYESQGWDYLHGGFIFAEGQPPYVVMTKELA